MKRKKEEYYFSAVYAISVLTNSNNPSNYWYKLKIKITEEEMSQLSTTKIKSSKDNKSYLTDTLDTEGIFKLIESVPSPKASSFKLWIAKLGHQKIAEVFDSSKGIA